MLASALKQTKTATAYHLEKVSKNFLIKSTAQSSLFWMYM